MFVLFPTPLVTICSLIPTFQAGETIVVILILPKLQENDGSPSQLTVEPVNEFGLLTGLSGMSTLYEFTEKNGMQPVVVEEEEEEEEPLERDA